MTAQVDGQTGMRGADGLRNRIEELRSLPLKAVERVDLPVSCDVAWELIGNLHRWPELSKRIDSVEIVPNGFRVTAASAVSTGVVDHEVPGVGLVGSYDSGRMFGLNLPTPDLDAFWVTVDDNDGGVTVELGRAFRFRNRLAQQAGRALVPLHQKLLEEIATGATRLLAPQQVAGSRLRVPELRPFSASPVSEGLSESDARRLRELKLTGHRAAMAAASFASGWGTQLTHDLGRLGTKATIWHAERTIRNRFQQSVAADDWPDLAGRLAATLDPYLEPSRFEHVLDPLAIGCRLLGLTTRSDLTAALGITAYGFAVGELEGDMYGDRPSRSVRKVVKALPERPGQSPEARLAEAAVAIAENRRVGKASASILNQPGFSSYVRELLPEAAGLTVDHSPDVPDGRSKGVKKRTPVLFRTGLASRLTLLKA